MHRDKRRAVGGGFTLIEVMMVVAIVGLLAVMAYPFFNKARLQAYAGRVTNDFRVFGGAFDQYAFEKGVYPPDSTQLDPMHLPPGAGMEDYLDASKWTLETPFGGYYEWEGPSVGHVGIAIVGSTAGLDEWEALDDMCDDGDTTTGLFQLMPTGLYTYLLSK